MSLKKYKAKRSFDKTPEPPPAGVRHPSTIRTGNILERGKLMFVVQKHHARQLHYDFRLEKEGVLKSWAVPKGIPEDIGIKHLAVMTEDHPIEYGSFEGMIPEGNYGAGKVEIWDKGKYVLLEEKKNSLKFELNGKLLKGKYVLFNFKDKNWFLFKMKNQ